MITLHDHAARNKILMDLLAETVISYQVSFVVITAGLIDLRSTSRTNHSPSVTETFRGHHEHNVGQQMIRCWATKFLVLPESGAI